MRASSRGYTQEASINQYRPKAYADDIIIIILEFIYKDISIVIGTIICYDNYKSVKSEDIYPI